MLNTVRIRGQWRTMTRTDRSPRLNRHVSEPFAELHPEDTAKFGIGEGELIRLQSRWGQTLARAKLTGDQRPGSVFMPIWSDRNSRQALSEAGHRIIALTDDNRDLVAEVAKHPPDIIVIDMESPGRDTLEDA